MCFKILSLIEAPDKEGVSEQLLSSVFFGASVAEGTVAAVFGHGANVVCAAA
jgi:hypothetical protein